MEKKIYLDYAASTPIDAGVLKAMMPYLKEHYGNPSSAHAFGQKARAAIEQSRIQAGEFLHCQADEVIFTSGATEANNLAIQGAIKFKSSNFKINSKSKTLNSKPHIVTSAIEHESLLEPCRQAEREGLAEVTYVKPRQDGVVRLEDVEKAVKPNTVLVSIMYANSEIGTMQPIVHMGNWLKSKAEGSKSKILFHTDAVQAANYLDCDVEKLGVDLLTLSGHKIYGPKGVGVLYRKKGVVLSAVASGGGQEMGLRSGTENVAAIVGMETALREIRNSTHEIRNRSIQKLRDALVKDVLKKIPQSECTGSGEDRLPNNAHFRFKGAEGRAVVMLLDEEGIAVSTGSACSERTQEPSHVLLALGLDRKEALSGVRITLGKRTTKEDIARVSKALVEAVLQLRKNQI